MHTDGIAEGVYTSIPNMFNHFFRRNDTVLMEQEIFQKAAFFSGKGKRHSIYRGFSCSGIKGKLIPFQAYILLNELPPGKASDPGFQLLEVQGLGKIIIGSQIQTVYFIFNLITGGQD